MLKRHFPPMYKRVKQKNPPTFLVKPKVEPVIVEKSPKVEEPVKIEESPKVEEPAGESVKIEESIGESIKVEEPIKVEESPLVIDWDASQKELYQIAKKAGLDVRTKDSKKSIVAALKKAGF